MPPPRFPVKTTPRAAHGAVKRGVSTPQGGGLAGETAAYGSLERVEGVERCTRPIAAKMAAIKPNQVCKVVTTGPCISARIVRYRLVVSRPHPTTRNSQTRRRHPRPQAVMCAPRAVLGLVKRGVTDTPRREGSGEARGRHDPPRARATLYITP